MVMATGDHEENDDSRASAEKVTRGSKHGVRTKPTPMAPALISLQPGGGCVVVAIGAALRVFDLASSDPMVLKDDTEPSRHADAIRTISFDAGGGFFCSGGDDKVVKLWDARTWTCIWTIRVSKKLSAITFSIDSEWVFFADKYGVVSVLPRGKSILPEWREEGPPQLMAHCCSIITSMAVSPDGRLVATADRDFKVRVSMLPKAPLEGAPEIVSFCLGHTLFVTCVSFTGSSDSHPSGLLLSGGGDGTIRLWHPDSGQLLRTLLLSLLAGGGGGGSCVVALAVAGDGASVAVGLQSTRAVFLLSCDTESETLDVVQRVELSERAPPTCLAFDSGRSLWVSAGGAEALESDDSVVTPQALAAAEIKAQIIAEAAKARVRVLRFRGPVAEVNGSANCAGCASESGANDGGADGKSDGRNGKGDILNGGATEEKGWGSERLPGGSESANDVISGNDDVDDNRGATGGRSMGGGGYEVLADAFAPGGAEMLRHLQGSLEGAVEAAAKAAEAAEVACHVDLNKRAFTQEERDFRKRTRNDKK